MALLVMAMLMVMVMAMVMAMVMVMVMMMALLLLVVAAVLSVKVVEVVGLVATRSHRRAPGPSSARAPARRAAVWMMVVPTRPEAPSIPRWQR